MRRVRAGLLAACLGLALSACSEEATVKTADGDISVKQDGKDVTITDDSGNTVTTGTRLPEGFPHDVPLLDGEITSAVAAAGPNGDGWSVAMLPEGSIDSVLREATDELDLAGFTVEGSQKSGDQMAMTMFRSDAWQVSATVMPASDGEVTLSYIVAPTPSSGTSE